MDINWLAWKFFAFIRFFLENWSLARKHSNWWDEYLSMLIAINIDYEESREENCIMKLNGKKNVSSAVISIIAPRKLTMIDNGPLNCLTFPLMVNLCCISNEMRRDSRHFLMNTNVYSTTAAVDEMPAMVKLMKWNGQLDLNSTLNNVN